MATPEKPRFRVIINGGGIGGLALANCLQHADVDYTLIEKRESLDPQIGASIGILPNGARILDQMGCLDDLSKVVAGLETSANRDVDGTVIGKVTDTLKLMEIRTGYPVFFIERQMLLRVLAEHIKEPGRIHLNKNVKEIDQSTDSCTVRFDDGTSVQGDIVVGADGVHSFTRREMWRHADLAGHGEMFAKDKDAMSAEYKCLFGISHNVPGMDVGQTDRTFAKDISTLSYNGKDGKVFWFVFIKMDKCYKPPHIPRFSEKEIPALIDEIGDLPIRQDPAVSVRTLYNTQVACNLVVIEEAEYQQWSHERIVCLGDSIHKMTPNLGAGASSAIESAAVLSNTIVKLAAQASLPTKKDILNAFKAYQMDRSLRVVRAARFSNDLTRLQALKGKKEHILIHHVLPHMDEFAAEMFSDFVIGAAVVDYLPLPERSLTGTMPFNPKQGWGHEESKVWRMVWALPLLALALGSLFTSSTSQRQSWSYGDATTPVLYLLWLFEGARLNNKLTLLQCPLLFGLAAQRTDAVVIGLFHLFFLHAQSPVSAFRASDNRHMEVAYSSTAALVVLGVVVGLNFTSDILSAEQLHWLWQAHPLIISLSQYVLAKLIGDTTTHDRLWAVKRDVPWVMLSAGVFASMSGAHWVYTVVNPAFFNMSTWQDLLRAVSLRHEAYLAVGVVYWLTLSARDLYRAGMTSLHWTISALMCCIAMPLVGPAAVLARGWMAREGVLLNRRHKDALVAEHV